MKKLMCLLLCVLLCLSLAGTALAAEDDFVPSIGYKDGPDIEDAEMDDENVGSCLIVTSIKEAEEKTTDITQEERDLLLEVYEELLDGSMELPIEEDHVIRELVDVSWQKEGCRDRDHGHEEWLKQEDTTVEVTFDLGIPAGMEVIVMAYIDGEWVEVPCVNNGDGTVTCIFEDICPVVFCVPVEEEADPPKTGDQILLWVLLMAASVAVLVGLVLTHRRAAR